MRSSIIWPICLVAVLLLAAPLVAEAQALGKVARVGVLWSTPPAEASPYFLAFVAELRNRGYVEGQNVTVVVRYAFQKTNSPEEAAAELVGLGPDVLVASSNRLIVALKHATGSIPIVMAPSGDPIAAGFVASLARPGGHVTGLSLLAPELSAKRLSLLKEAWPRLSRVAVLSNPTNPGTPAALRETEDAARSLNMRLHVVDAERPEDFDRVLSTARTPRVDALFVLPDELFFVHRARLIELANKARLPTMFYLRGYVDTGGLMAYGPNFRDLWRRSAYYVDRILKGAKPADLPVEQPTTFEFVINMRTAKALGLTIPPSLLLRADEVIR